MFVCSVKSAFFFKIFCKGEKHYRRGTLIIRKCSENMQEIREKNMRKGDVNKVTKYLY